MHRVPLYGYRNVVRGYAEIDDEDLTRVTAHRWHLLVTGYAANGERTLMHRFILGLKRGDPEVDHINGIKLDNRRSNLRLATRSQNEQNKNAARANSVYSRQRGVTYDNRGQPLAKRWIAQGSVGGRNRFLGRFATEEEAGEAARAFRREHMPFSSDAR